MKWWHAPTKASLWREIMERQRKRLVESIFDRLKQRVKARRAINDDVPVSRPEAPQDSAQDLFTVEDRRQLDPCAGEHRIRRHEGQMRDVSLDDDVVQSPMRIRSEE